MASVSDAGDLGLWYVLNRLETSYWREVDCNGGIICKLFPPMSGAGV
jgi:hypothetical protein